MSSSSLGLVESIIGDLDKTTMSSSAASAAAVPSKATAERAPVLLLFDVDGTLSKSRQKAEQFMWDLLDDVRTKVHIAIVGGSDYPKQQEQLERGGMQIKDYFDFVFSENGLVAFKDGVSCNDHSLLKELTEEELQEFINFCLHYIADLKIPVKRGTFVEFRTGMINVCPVGRNCSQRERDAFYAYDQEHEVRATMIKVFEAKLPHLAAKLKSSIGGQISYDVFPHGWDKTYCLKFLKDLHFKEIHFFGDKTHAGGNDHEIYEDARTIGHKVKSPRETVEQVKEIMARLESEAS